MGGDTRALGDMWSLMEAAWLTIGIILYLSIHLFLNHAISIV
jgi:hypothetical protein